MASSSGNKKYPPRLYEIYGHRIEEAEVSLLSWHGSRQRINFPNFSAQEDPGDCGVYTLKYI
ncbi:hypothetical protein DY000_02014114 [Brassica cretica]|uniref:Ubiquitin-like protease family profile domain-containing protein n=1 Tax=Brassica cretica TaxID=69181 RepID=A0ABQ7D230_BRACR|nr:hypothetical protein DY000_02014114 [Brassica cretica]